ncbi:MAG TPA: hypothetical protein VGP12_00745 [Nitrosospira sp.]|nr:hypothetical protein [Nitrosospira sp.]
MRAFDTAVPVNHDCAGLTAERAVRLDRAHLMSASRKFRKDVCTGIALKLQARSEEIRLPRDGA